MRFDSDGRFRHAVMLQFGKVYKVYQPGTLILLLLANASLYSDFLVNRGFHPYASIGLVFLGMTLVLFVVAHVYVRKVNLNEFQHRAEIEMNPYAVNHLLPIDEIRWGMYYIPSMTAYYNILKKTDPSNEYLPVLKENLVKIKRWVELGYIPPSDAPEHLKKLFEQKLEMRL